MVFISLRYGRDNEDNVYNLSSPDLKSGKNSGVLIKYGKTGSLQLQSQFNETWTVSDRLNEMLANKRSELYIFARNDDEFYFRHYSPDGDLLHEKVVNDYIYFSSSTTKMDDHGNIYLSLIGQSEGMYGITKLDASLNTVWRIFFNKSDDLYSPIYIALNGSGETVFATVLATFNNEIPTYAIHLYKSNADGQLVWHRYTPTDSPHLRFIEIDQFGNVYAANRGELMKLDMDGDMQWQKTFEYELTDFTIDNWGYPLVRLYNYGEGLIFIKYLPNGDKFWQYTHEFEFDDIYSSSYWDPQMVCDAYGRSLISFGLRRYSNWPWNMTKNNFIVLNRQGVTPVVIQG